ncbi:MAG: SLBB domain-containing protein [Ignavibacteriales bacterium]|nr:MAG: SLBB domain-containing protein [Ignavibacteriales bacterium]
MKKSLVVFFCLMIMKSYNAQTLDDLYSRSNLGMQSISVTLGGDFIVTGTFAAFVTERIDQFITRIHTEAKEISLRNISDPVMLEKVNTELKKYSMRNIRLLRNNGEEIKIDLEMYHIDGNLTNNPYLKNDDVIIFPAVDTERNFFSITGAVNRPGKYAFVDGDELGTAIKLAMGLNPAYRDITTAEISRLSYDGQTMSSEIVNVNDDIKLERGDRIIIQAVETQKKDFKVSVYGEVNSPGEIPITKNSTSLRDVIYSAGGLTENASLKRARLFAGNSLQVLLEKQFGIKINQSSFLQNEELLQAFMELENRLMYRMSNITEEDTAYFFLENYIRLVNQTGSVDFQNLLNDSSNTYVVKDGDIIFIPQKENVIYVFGQVRNAGKIKFIDGKDYSYYLDQAGGVGEYAQDEIMLIKHSSREWISLEDNKVQIEDGDFIWVPRSSSHSFNYYVQAVGNYLGIVGSAATIILLLIQLGK